MSTGRQRPPFLSPKQLNLYYECPERFFHERVERRRGEPQSRLAMAKGIAVHDVLRDIGNHYQKNGNMPADLDERVRRALPRSEYPSIESWEQALETAVHEVEFGVTVFNGEGSVLATEKDYEYLSKARKECPQFMLTARVDLLMLRHDADGKPFLDVMDFKGGAGSIDPLQELACRVVVSNHAKRVGFGVSFDYIQNSTVRTGVGEIRSVTLDDEDFRRGWQKITQIVSSIIEGTDWHPVRSPLCESCPYFMDGCSIAPDPDGPDELGDWLDGIDL
jgi:hypothetical protein